jgi:thiol-disulfide isomerase/thioredoxin
VIFVDCYTTWCGPCKIMARDVFPDKEVGDFYNQHFINVKMDMEKGEGPKFGKTYPVSAYPTLYYIEPNGEVVMSQRGARKAKDLIDLGRSALGKTDFSAEYREKYEAGDRDPELILDYIKVLNKSSQSSLKVVNEFLRENVSLEDSVNQAIVLEGTTEADSKPYSILTANKQLFERQFGEEKIRKVIEAACERTSAKGAEYEYFELVEQAMGEMKKHVPDRYDAFQYLAPMYYYVAQIDFEGFYKYAQPYVKKEIKKDAEALHNLSNSVRQNFKFEPEAEPFVEELLLAASKYGDDYNYDLDLARFYYKQQRYDESRKYAESSRDKAEKAGKSLAPAENFLMLLDNRGDLKSN